MGVVQDLVTQNPVKRFLVNRFPAWRREMARAHARAMALERASTAEILHHQQEGLRALLSAAASSPYYGGILKQWGKDPAQAWLEDLRSLPFLTKDVIREQGPALRIPGAVGVYENYSGGSTGAPILFWQDQTHVIHMSASTRRCNELAGAFPGARMAKLWGAPQDRGQIEGLRGRARLWLLNTRYYDSFDMGVEKMEAYHRDMEQFQPDLIQAYASSIHLLARFLKTRGIRPTYPRVSIITAAEKLYPHMRREIEEVFPARVFDRYGSRELAATAAECDAHDGLHILMSSYIVETIDPVSGVPVEGEPGEIVITAPYNRAMPFLRYRIGDMGTIERKRCACGRTFYRLREVAGRTTDNFLMEDGRIVHGEYFTHAFYGRPGIEQFQFVQNTLTHFTLRIVPAAGYSTDLVQRIEREIRDVIGERPALDLELTREIPKTSSGKYRFTISHVRLDDVMASKK